MLAHSAARRAGAGLAWLAAAGVAAAFGAGCAELERAAPIRPVAVEAILDRPARLTVLRTITPLDANGDTVGAVLVNLEGQNLRATTADMRLEAPLSGTLRGFLAAARMAYKFTLHEVRGRGARTLGYLLVRQGRIATFFLDEDGTLSVSAIEVQTP